MKKELFEMLFKEMETNKDMYLLFADLGFNYVDNFLQAYPDRAFTLGASEQCISDIVVGLSLSGKLPVMYTISSFYWRCSETIRAYIDHENLHCILIGAGRDEEYGQHDGFSHSATDIPKLFELLENVEEYYPDTKKELVTSLTTAILNNKPNFINIHR